jgi:hypothetical protein
MRRHRDRGGDGDSRGRADRPQATSVIGAAREAAISAALSYARKVAGMAGGGRLTALDNETQRIILVPAAPRLTPRR